MAGNTRRRAPPAGDDQKGPTVRQRRPAAGAGGRGPTPRSRGPPNHQGAPLGVLGLPVGNRGPGTAVVHASGRGSAPAWFRPPTAVPRWPWSRGFARPRRPPGTRVCLGEVVAGRNSVLESLRMNVPATTLWPCRNPHRHRRPRPETLARLPSRGCPSSGSRAEIDRLTDGGSSPGARACRTAIRVCERGDLIDPEIPGVPLVVALDGVTDPRNVGPWSVRLPPSASMGVLVPERRSAGMTAAAWEGLRGAAAPDPRGQATNLTGRCKDLQKAGFFVLGLDMDGDVSLPETRPGRHPVVIVVGGAGCPPCRSDLRPDRLHRCPPPWVAQRGASPGVALYEVARGRLGGRAERASSGPEPKPWLRRREGRTWHDIPR